MVQRRGLDAWLCGGAKAGLKRNGAKGVADARMGAVIFFSLGMQRAGGRLLDCMD